MKFILVILGVFILLALIQFVFFVADPFRDSLSMKSMSLKAFQNVLPVKTDIKDLEVIVASDIPESKMYKEEIEVINMITRPAEFDKNATADWRITKYMYRKKDKNNLDPDDSSNLNEDEEDEYEIVKVIMTPGGVYEETSEEIKPIYSHSTSDESSILDVFAKDDGILVDQEENTRLDMIVLGNAKKMIVSKNSLYTSLISSIDKAIKETDQKIKNEQYIMIKTKNSKEISELAKKMSVFSTLTNSEKMKFMFQSYSRSFAYLSQGDFQRFEHYYLEAKKLFYGYLIT